MKQNFGSYIPLTKAYNQGRDLAGVSLPPFPFHKHILMSAQAAILVQHGSCQQRHAVASSRVLGQVAMAQDHRSTITGMSLPQNIYTFR